MSEHRVFKAFLSYAHQDAVTDPELIPAFATALENCVNAHIVNARFVIWRDSESLRNGGTWSTKTEEELRSSDVLIVLVTPRWLESDICRKEYAIFEGIEADREIGEYIAPIIFHSIARQEGYLSDDQQETYNKIKSRQYQEIVATEFRRLSKAKRGMLIERVADDIEGMIERRTVLLEQIPLSEASDTPRKPRKEFSPRAHNFEMVDFVTDGEIVLSHVPDERYYDVLAHVSFVERLYVQGKGGRIDFAIQRAFLTLRNDGPGSLSKVDRFKDPQDLKNAYYVTLHDAPDALTVCIDPPEGKPSLAELALPPTPTENFLSVIATASGDIDVKTMAAELIVTLNAEGIHLFEDHAVSPRTLAAIKAILNVAKARVVASNNETVDDQGRFRRKLAIRERR